jgi:VWFA-related protein
MQPGLAVTALAWFLSLASSLGGQQDQSGRPSGPTFRSGVDMVTVNAVVKDRKGRLVTTLTRESFALIDDGRPRQILDFRPDSAPISTALLIDSSGSMQVADKVEDARKAAALILAQLEPNTDEVAMFTFDTEFKELRGFTGEGTGMQNLLDQVHPFGMTSLYDAIAETARRVAARGRSHRAVIVLTDGIDTSSALTAPEVSGAASAIDVPVYIVAVTSPLDHPGGPNAVKGSRNSPLAGELVDLARWTGGELFVSSQPSQMYLAARQIIGELRHQYLIAFEPDSRPGWHPLELRVRDRNLSVRARGGYFAGRPRQGS